MVPLIASSYCGIFLSCKWFFHVNYFFHVKEISIETIHQGFGLWGQKWIHFLCNTSVGSSVLSLVPRWAPFFLLNPSWNGHRRGSSQSEELFWKGMVTTAMWDHKPPLIFLSISRKILHYFSHSRKWESGPAHKSPTPRSTACTRELLGWLLPLSSISDCSIGCSLSKFQFFFFYGDISKANL